MFTQKQIKGMLFCFIGLLSLIFSIVVFTDRGGYTYGFMYLLAAFTFATIGFFDVVDLAALMGSGTIKNAPQQNNAPKTQNDENNTND